VRTQNFSLGAGADPVDIDPIQFMFDFNNCVIKIMSEV
jgi:hypothetical protein